MISPEGTIENPYNNFIALSRYARWIESEGRRETWRETVTRYVNYMSDKLADRGTPLPEETKQEVYDAILNLEVMPSMRALMTSGEALDRENIAGYNCAFVAVDNLRAFDEALYIMMNGTGLGFSVESKYVEKLPTIANEFYKTESIIVVHDSKLGWAKAYKELISFLVNGHIPKIDVSRVRPAGARLKVFGGRASGPQPLVDLFDFTVATFKRAAGRKLKPIECHDIMCKVGAVVVVGGVRRSAEISLSDIDDYDMARAKAGNWWEDNGQRSLANNSAVYQSKPSVGQFLKEWKNLYDSKSGERGIVNMDGIRKHIDRFGIRDSSKVAGMNPCAEILLRNGQFCNLTEVVINPNDNLDDLKRKVRIATILGTYQATLTDFKYIRKMWQNNTEEERLLGVSLTGIMGHRVLGGVDDYMEHDSGEWYLEEILEELRSTARETNEEWAGRFGIPASAAITCTKPSGTVSQLVGSSSGIHPWYAPYYIRTVRGDNKDPLTKLMKDEGIPNEPDVMNPENTTVFSFPIKAPEGVPYTNSLTAIEHLELWKKYRTMFTEHNPSVTISVGEDEWLDVGAWVFKNFDYIGGVSFLPRSEHTYKQAPYQEISEEAYNEALANFPKEIKWDLLSAYELEDTTTGTQELACVSGQCDII